MVLMGKRSRIHAREGKRREGSRLDLGRQKLRSSRLRVCPTKLVAPRSTEGQGFRKLKLELLRGSEKDRLRGICAKEGDGWEGKRKEENKGELAFSLLPSQLPPSPPSFQHATSLFLSRQDYASRDHQPHHPGILGLYSLRLVSRLSRLSRHRWTSPERGSPNRSARGLPSSPTPSGEQRDSSFETLCLEKQG